MKSSRHPFLVTAVALLVASATHFPHPSAFAQEPEEAEVLTRGPLHEAFGGSVDYNPEPGILIAAQPPEPIEELPPDLQPEGDNVTWISGYWAWDEDLDDFLWVSGIWRAIPPDREWVPGYWNEINAQFQWISGYWAEAEASEVTYLPPPPKTVESGPNVDPPSSDDSWIPGVWVWVDERYLWRPGYWEPFREDWTYMPDHYRWTPRGHIFINGYWDYGIARRGVVFAPVYFHGHGYRRPGFHYAPTTVISISLLTNHLFVRPSYSHYYYGDYYEPRYRERGFFASFSYHSGRRGYDPFYAHQRWQHRRDPGWDRRRRADFDYCRDNRDSRPPRTWASARELSHGRRGSKGRHGEYVVASPISHFAKATEKRERFHKVDGPSRERIMAQRKDLSEFGKERRQREAEPSVARRGDTVGGEAKPTRGKVSRSPIVGQRSENLAKEDAPPKRRQVPTATSGKPTAGREAAREASESRGKPSQPKADPQRETRGQPSQPKADPQRETRGQPSQPKAEPRVQPKAEPQRETRGQPSAPKVQPRVQPKPPSKVVPRPGPKPPTQVQPRPQPKAPSNVVPRPGPKSEPKVQPRPQPKAQPKSQPKPQPKAQHRPQAQPKSPPKSEPKRKSEAEDDERKGKKK